MIELPKEKLKADTKSPTKLLIFSKPKVGKTSALAQLDNALIIDLEKGSSFVEALKYDIQTMAEKNNRSPLQELKELCKAIKEAGKPYKYIVVDTVTKLEDMVLPLALQMYKATPQGKSYDGQNVLHLPNGAGYQYLRDALFTVLYEIYSCADKIILLGHLKSKVLEKNGKEVNSADVDLTGKIKSMISADVDAIGLLYRETSNKNILTFKTTDDVICGARSTHLKNQDITLSEVILNNELKTYWDKIYID
jgi:hypothetical protein